MVQSHPLPFLDSFMSKYSHSYPCASLGVLPTLLSQSISLVISQHFILVLVSLFFTHTENRQDFKEKITLQDIIHIKLEKLLSENSCNTDGRKN